VKTLAPDIRQRLGWQGQRKIRPVIPLTIAGADLISLFGRYLFEKPSQPGMARPA
jgi:hypothetical protein